MIPDALSLGYDPTEATVWKDGHPAAEEISPAHASSSTGVED